MSATSIGRGGLLVRTGLLALLLGVLGVTVTRSTRAIRQQGEIEAVCALSRAGDHAGAAAASELLAAQVDGLQAVDLVDCRCGALLALGRGRECLPLVQKAAEQEELTASAAGIGLYVALNAEEEELALRLARLYAERFPPLGPALYGELMARLWSESPAEVAAALGPRIAALPPEQTVRARLTLAQRLAQAEQVDEALRVLEPPDTQDLERWFLVRNQILADAGRQFELAQSFQRWESLGGRPARLMLLYALISEHNGLKDAERRFAELYQQAIERGDPVLDADLLEEAYLRLIGYLVINERPAEAEAWMATARDRGIDVRLSTDELDRLMRGSSQTSGDGRVQFSLPAFQAGDLLKIAPSATAPADSPYEVITLGGAQVGVTRTPGETPVRWAWTTADGRPLASGVVWPDARRPASVAISERPGPGPAPTSFTWSSPPGDGKTGVYVLILDCADWRLIRYLQARGELPVLSALERAGRAGVLTSVPAMTGTAMEKLTRPRVSSTFTFLSYLHHMGAELGGLSSVGKNPLDGLHHLLPENPYILDVVGATDKVGANMLFSHGAKVEAGRNAELVGPKGQRRTLEGLVYRRELSPEERALIPGDGTVPVTVMDIAAEMDIASQLVKRRDIDLLLLRVEPLDLVTHGHYADTAATGRDDGKPYLYQTYRYIDHRLAEVVRAVDQDDVLVVMSDHGIQASMMHDPEAMFIAVGQGVSPGRLEGQPELAGVPRALLDRLGVTVPEGWPDTGLSAALPRP